MLSHQRITLEAKDARGIDHRVENHAAGELSRVRRELRGDVPLGLLERRGQTLALAREGQPDRVICLLGSS
jgi:hypothetical protein